MLTDAGDDDADCPEEISKLIPDGIIPRCARRGRADIFVGLREKASGWPARRHDGVSLHFIYLISITGSFGNIDAIYWDIFSEEHPVFCHRAYARGSWAYVKQNAVVRLWGNGVVRPLCMVYMPPHQCAIDAQYVFPASAGKTAPLCH